MVQHLIILRGPPGIGKSTISKKLANHISGNVAVVDIDVLRYDFIPKRNEDFNDHALVYSNLKDICKNTLKEGLSIILEGILASKDKNGNLRIDEFEKFSKSGIKATRIFLHGGRETQELRLKKKNAHYSYDKVQEWTQLANSTITNKDFIINTDNKTENMIVDEILNVIKIHK